MLPTLDFRAISNGVDKTISTEAEIWVVVTPKDITKEPPRFKNIIHSSAAFAWQLSASGHADHRGVLSTARSDRRLFEPNRVQKSKTKSPNLLCNGRTWNSQSCLTFESKILFLRLVDPKSLKRPAPRCESSIH